MRGRITAEAEACFLAAGCDAMPADEYAERRPDLGQGPTLTRDLTKPVDALNKPVRETPLLSNVCIEPIISPGQAWDKHGPRKS